MVITPLENNLNMYVSGDSKKWKAIYDIYIIYDTDGLRTVFSKIPSLMQDGSRL